MRLNSDQVAELEMLRDMHGGNLRPEIVRDFARSSNTALHSIFVGDDSAHAERWRLHLARECIRCVVTLLPAPGSGQLVQVRAYSFDARREAYRATIEVLSDEDDATILLSRMMIDVQRIVARYRRHAKLVPHIESALAALRPKPETDDDAAEE